MTQPGFIKITSPDGHAFDCWSSPAEGHSRGAVVVLQEIFGVNPHIQSVCARLAKEGYDAYAPALFDRLQPGFTSGYSKEEVAEALKLLPRIDWKAMVVDTLATADLARRTQGSVALMGFCLGASVAWMAAQSRPGIAAVVGYYGGQIVEHLERPAQSPTLLHYGETDHTIPMVGVERTRAERPEVELHVYPAGHGFNCDARASYEPASAQLAWERSLRWLAAHRAA
ncbi:MULTISPECIES: dienelactone hydrolase family protein [unclassified Variovorax]|uniref:dienelactone hydrolase family protein n=1 Tax=unclassified Variovorax TaxID=663243 RepID=UPI003F4523E0